MITNSEEMLRLRLHIGIRSDYKDIRQNDEKTLVGSQRYGGVMTPLPGYEKEIKRASLAFQYLSSPLLHDLNRMNMMLDTWEEQLPPVPRKVLGEIIQTMEHWIESHGGKA